MQASHIHHGMFAFAGNFAQAFDHQAGDGIVITLWKLDACKILNFVNGGDSFHSKGILADPVNLFFFVVEFILNISHDGFQQILHGDKPLSSAVFIHDNGDGELALCHLGEKIAAGLAFGNKIGRAHELRDFYILCRGPHIFQQVLYINDADNGIQIFVVDGDAGVTLF